MAPLPLSFGLSSNRGRLKLDNSVTLMNAYAEPLGAGGKAQIALYAAPGLKRWCDLRFGGFRGAMVQDGSLYVASGPGLFKIDVSGRVTDLSGLPGSGLVTFASNALATADTIIVADGAAYHLKQDRLTTYSSDAFTAPISTAIINGRFIFPLADGRWFYSNVNTTDVFGDSFYNAEGKPDGLVRAFVRRNELWLFGRETLEIWADTGDENDPFTRLGGGARAIGCVSAASVVELDDRIFWVDDNNHVRMAVQYDGQKISTPFISRLIEAEPDKAGIRCDTYQLGGWDWLLVQGTTFSALYNIDTNQWTERETAGLRRWQGSGAIVFNDQVIVGDVSQGRLYTLETDHDRDGDQPLHWYCRSPIVHAWPQPLALWSLHLDVLASKEHEPGDVSCRVSFDGGSTYGSRLYEPLQTSERSGPRVVFRRLGTAERTGATIEVGAEASTARGMMAALINADSGTT